MEINKVILHGDALNQDGYGSHVSQLSKAINKIIPVQLKCQKPYNWEEFIKDKELKEMLSRNFDVEDCVNIMIALPIHWEILLSQNPKKFVGFFVWESEQIPQYWIPLMNDERVSQIWVPSTFVLNACINNGVNKNKLFIVPHGCDRSIFYPKKEY